MPGRYFQKHLGYLLVQNWDSINWILHIMVSVGSTMMQVRFLPIDLQIEYNIYLAATHNGRDVAYGSFRTNFMPEPEVLGFY